MQGKVKEVGSALAAVGIGAQGRAAVFSVNCPEWMIVLQVTLILAMNRLSFMRKEASLALCIENITMPVTLEICSAALLCSLMPLL